MINKIERRVKKKMKTKTLVGLGIFGFLVALTLMTSVMAITRPPKPVLAGDLSKIDYDFRVPVFPSLSITGVDAVAVNEPTNHDFRLEAPYYPDKDISDLKYSWFFGIWAIMDDAGNIVRQIDKEKDLGTLNVYSGKIQHTFTEPGVYYYVPAILEVKQEFIDGEWQVVSEEIIKKEVAKVNVAGYPERPTLLESISNFFSRLWDWILSLFT